MFFTPAGARPRGSAKLKDCNLLFWLDEDLSQEPGITIRSTGCLPLSSTSSDLKSSLDLIASKSMSEAIMSGL